MTSILIKLFKTLLSICQQFHFFSKLGTEIRGTFFKEACDKFRPLIEEGKVGLSRFSVSILFNTVSDISVPPLYSMLYIVTQKVHA